MSGHRKNLKHSFMYKLAQAITDYRKSNKIPLSKISLQTDIPEGALRRVERTGNLDWASFTKLLYYFDKWIKVELVDYQQQIYKNKDNQD